MVENVTRRPSGPSFFTSSQERPHFLSVGYPGTDPEQRRESANLSRVHYGEQRAEPEQAEAANPPERDFVIVIRDSKSLKCIGQDSRRVRGGLQQAVRKRAFI